MIDQPISADTQVPDDDRSSILDDPDAPISRSRAQNSLCRVQVPIPWQPVLLADIRAARSRIVLTALSMLPPRSGQRGAWPALWYAISERAAAGVRVELTLPAPSRAHAAAAQNHKAAATAHAAGWHVTLIPGPRLLHAKQIIVDGMICWLGSANLTAAAFSFNTERFARIESLRFADRLMRSIAALNHQPQGATPWNAPNSPTSSISSAPVTEAASPAGTAAPNTTPL
jgi:phosphatidylserine/phosphatidylglycerophosphate/cardiolipin synthase-like enzyme